MKTSPVCHLLACFLAISLLISAFPVRVTASGGLTSGEDIPQMSVPEESVPDESVPDESVPDESVPGESVPDESVPDESVPDESIPEESVPDESVPGESVPGESVPDESVPGESVPGESVPDESIPVTSAPDTLCPAAISEAESPLGPGVYFGLLGAHSGISEGTGTVESLFLSAAGTPGLDFFAVTDHSDSFDGHEAGDLRTPAGPVSTDWRTGKAAAAAVTTASFVGLFGYEMSWPSRMFLGHLSTFGTPGFQSWDQDTYSMAGNALENYYAALASVPEGVSQFSHPGTQYGTFNNFRYYSAEADRVISLLELDFRDQNLLRYYIQALDQGWHVAPTAGQHIYNSSWADNGVRTAVHVQSLTEAGILNALKHCRAYATEDPDLEVLFSMDGHPMGSRLELQPTGNQAALSVTVKDPSDGAACTVEVITNGGQTAAQGTLSGPSGTLSFSLPSAPGYYFLRITQPDGQQAVTAPIWLEGTAQPGIASLCCDTPVPVRREPVSLTAMLYNQKNTDFLVDSLEILADGTPVACDDTLTCVPAQTTLSHPITVAFDCAGLTEVTVRLSGSLEGRAYSCEASLQLNIRQSEQISGILVDKGHKNTGTEDLNCLRAMAAEANIRFQEEDSITTEILGSCRFLLVTAPQQPFSEEFLSAAAGFAGYGGSIILCGHDGDPTGNRELNRLLSAIGATLRILPDPVRDDTVNNGNPHQINTQRLNRDLPWCSGISEGHIYRAFSACAIDPGQGDWIVKANPTAGTGDDVLLACEELSGGGSVFAAGSLFLSDEALSLPQTLWDDPYANRILAENLLQIGGESLPLTAIAQARKESSGQLLRIRGYVTAGTANLYNRFPDTLYLQDDTGGIAVIPFPDETIHRGTPLEITGYAGTKDGNPILKISSWKVLPQDPYLYLPLTGPWGSLLDMDRNGGRLVQVEGTCREIRCRQDDTMASCLLEDGLGNTAVVMIEDSIGNSSDGRNELHRTIRRGRTVRAMGLLHSDEYGNTVIRVRNCEDVVWVPPRNYRNPRTGDFLLPGCASAMPLSALGLILLKKRKMH